MFSCLAVDTNWLWKCWCFFWLISQVLLNMSVNCWNKFNHTSTIVRTKCKIFFLVQGLVLAHYRWLCTPNCVPLNSPSNVDIPNCARFGCDRVPARASQSPVAESVSGCGATVTARDGTVAGYILPRTRRPGGGRWRCENVWIFNQCTFA